MPQPRSSSSRSSGGSARTSRAKSSTGGTAKRATASSSSASKRQASGSSASKRGATSAKASASTPKRTTASTAKRTTASTAKRTTSSAGKRASASTGTRRRAAAATDGFEVQFEAAAQRIRKLNERIIEAGRDAGQSSLNAYEKALKSIATSLDRGAGRSDVEWVSHMLSTQAKFIRDVTDSLTSAARSAMK